MPRRLTEEQRALIEAHMEFATAGARKRFGQFGRTCGLELADYQSAAYMGLVQAALKFEPSRGFTFKTYAFDWCEKYMGLLVREHRRFSGWSYAPTRKEQDGGAPRSQMVRVAHVGAWPVNEQGEEIELPGSSECPSAAIERAEVSKLLLASARNPRERTILDGLFHGKTYKQIAAEIGKTHGLVWMLKPRILERARKYLEARGITQASI